MSNLLDDIATRQKTRTNLTAYGTLTDDPRPINTKIGLLVDFSICYKPDPNFSPTYINFTCMDPDVSEYIVENFRKGDLIYVTKATPKSRKGQNGRVFFKFLVWDIVPKNQMIEEDGEEE